MLACSALHALRKGRADLLSFGILAQEAVLICSSVASLRRGEGRACVPALCCLLTVVLMADADAPGVGAGANGVDGVAAAAHC